MDIRRRNPENIGAGESVEISTTSPKARNPLINKGLQLYEEAEQTGFNNTETLNKSLKFFIQAAEQGVDEGTDWIKTFLGSLSALPASVVLPDSLVKVMKWITEATDTEKQVRNTAKSMFHKMSDAQKSIHKDDIDRCAEKLLSTGHNESVSIGDNSGLMRSSKLLKGSVKRLLQESVIKSGTKEITEETFCDIAAQYAKGEFQSPSLFGAQELSEEQLEDFKKANLIKKVYEYPWQTLRYFKMTALKQIEHSGIKWLWSSFPTKQFYILLIAYILPMVTVSFVVSSIATVVFFIAFAVMIIATLQLVLTSEQNFLMLEYSSIFQYFSEGGSKIDMKVPRDRLIQYAVGPYIAFATSLAISALTIGLAHGFVVIYELITVVAAFFTFGLFFEFEMYKSSLVLLLVASRSVSWLYVLLTMLQEYLPFSDILFFASRNIIFSIPIFPGVWIGVNLLSLVQFPLQFIALFYMLYKNSWRNFFAGLGPVMLFICWGALCRNFLYMSNPHYLLMAGGGMLAFILSLPFLPAVFLLSPTLVFFYFGATRPFFVFLSLFIVGSLFLLLFVINFKRIKEAKWLNLPLQYFIVLQILIASVFVIVGSMLYASIHEPGSFPVVTSQQYANHCVPNLDGDANFVQSQIDCFHLKDRTFETGGTIGVVAISNVINNPEASLQPLPAPVKTALSCLFGSAKPMCGNADDQSTCIYSGCNFEHSLKYTLKIGLTLNFTVRDHTATLSATLLSSNKFLPAVLKLKTGTHLKFNATFVSGMGSNQLILQANSLLLPTGELFDGKVLYNDEEERDQIFLKFVQSFKNTVYLLLEVFFGYAI